MTTKLVLIVSANPESGEEHRYYVGYESEDQLRCIASESMYRLFVDTNHRIHTVTVKCEVPSDSSNTHSFFDWLSKLERETAQIRH